MSAKAALINELQLELAKHVSNLERALAGQSSEFVPNSGEREKIETELNRLTSILRGLMLLRTEWKLTNNNTTVIRRPKKRSDLLAFILADTAIAIMRSGEAYAMQYRYGVEDLKALNDLFLYLNSKIYHLSKLPTEISHTEFYSTLHSDFGYLPGIPNLTD